MKNKLKKRRVLITGAGGFIGSHLTEELVKIGAEVTALTRYTSDNNNGWIDTLPTKTQEKITITKGDIQEPTTIHEITKNQEYIFHLAAIISIPYSYQRPEETFRTNTIGTLNILNAAKQHNIHRTIITSTSEVYGTAQTKKISEKHKLQAQSPYAASKIASDKITESYYNTYETPVTTIRPFNTYGERQSTRAIIPTIITQALTQKIIKLGNLQTIRDLTYVKDTVQGFIKIAQTNKAIGKTINLGTGKEITIKELTEKIIQKTNSKAKIKTEKKRYRPKKSEVQRLCSNNTQAKELLKWKPTTTINEGLNKTIEWYKKNITNYKKGGYTI